MPEFYHYTDDEGAEKIIRTGKIMASLKTMASDNAAYGNGVYLTKLKPPTSSKTEIAQNNWLKTSPQFVNKTKNYFVLDLPISDVKDFNSAGRNIFIFDNRKDLSLLKFPWWLKDFDTGKTITSYKYTMASYCPASTKCNEMGDYAMTDETVNGRPVYKSSKPNQYLFITSRGNWIVGNNTGEDKGFLHQQSNSSLGPDADSSVPWFYLDHSIDHNNKWNEDDFSLRAHAWLK